jgi:hypothetical protein
MKVGTPTVRVATIEDNAYYRIMASAPPPEYVRSGTPEALQLADALAMLAANTVQADLYVTDRALPIALGRDDWSPVTLMSADDALPVVGLFLRRQRKFILARKPALGDPNQPTSEFARDQIFFYWEAAGLVLPDSWRWRAATESYARTTGNESLRLLNTALHHRLSQVLRSRDNLLAQTSVTQNMDTADDILNDLDTMLVWLMAAFDVVARVCHTVFGITGSHRTAGWQKENWIPEVAVHNATLAGFFADGGPGDSVMTLFSKLRNNIHGERFRPQG